MAASSETTLETLFVDELRDIYHAERQLVKALPKLAKAASSPDLREALESHLAETEEHVSRCEQAFEMIGESPRAKTCEGMMGIIEEGSNLIREEDKGPALDAGIIAGGQRAEHYEMAAYGTLMAWAKALGHEDVADLLSTTLEEEKAADEKLSALAESGVNEAAAAGGESADEASEDEDEETSSANGRASNGRSRSGNGSMGSRKMAMAGAGSGSSSRGSSKTASRAHGGRR